MNCHQCAHWDLKKSPMRATGFGLCKADKTKFAAARTFAPTNECRFDAFKQAAPETVAAREKALA